MTQSNNENAARINERTAAGSAAPQKLDRPVLQPVPRAGAEGSVGSTITRPRSLAGRMCLGEASAVLSFAGQGAPCIDELAELHAHAPLAREWIEAAGDTLRELAELRPFRWSGMLASGYDIARWARDESTRPSSRYLASSLISQPLIFVTQMARYRAAHHEGLSDAFEAKAVRATMGHSQGVMPSVLVAESQGGVVSTARFLEFVRYMAWQGLHMAESWAKATLPPARNGAMPMAAVSGLRIERLEEGVKSVNRAMKASPGAQSESKGTLPIVLALHNTRTRFVVSGPPAALELLRSWLDRRFERETLLERQGRLGGRARPFTWEDLPVGGAYHSPAMAAGLESMKRTVKETGFCVDAADLRMTCVSPATAEPLNRAADLTAELIRMQFVEPVRWTRAVRFVGEASGATHVLDLGPGDAAARLTRSALRGSGMEVVALATTTGRERLFTEGAAEVEVPPIRYELLAPSLAASVRPPLAHNRFTEATGCRPIILAGMTPTTSDVEIVAAAANAGFVAELAGGGQVSERIFELRMEELAAALNPGREVVFNALYLDPYLWDLHVRRAALVLKARRAGAPLCGVTMSAGIPPVDEALRTLDQLAEAGLWLNAFKPGTAAQVEQVGRIAKAARDHTIFVQVEGGRGGGHHSWEELDELLLEAYDRLREESNVILCAGGGIGEERRAVELLTGEWARGHGLSPRPVDAVLLGTLAMACKESKASESVKRALVEAKGHEGWVLAGESRGGVTSGKSQLGADIHYIDNAASRCGRLLDEVAGNEEAVKLRREEIIAALSKTARPYFGDLEEMSWLEVLWRMVALMAIGEGGRYEDGIWPDVTWRERVAEVLWRAEQRLAGEGRKVESVLRHAEELDDPGGVLARFAKRWPAAAELRPHPADVQWFVHDVCARPGKPVGFVPVIDAGVRRWYKSDSLWQQDSSRWRADQVLVLPGPEAVRGITRANEPVAELLGRFDRALAKSLDSEKDSRRTQGPGSHELPRGLVMEKEGPGLSLRAGAAAAPGAFLDAARARVTGPAAALLSARRLTEGKQSRPNPLSRLIVAEPGATLEIAPAADGIVWRSPGGGESVSVSAPRNESGAAKARVEIRVAPMPGESGAAPLVLEWSVHPRSGRFVAAKERQSAGLRAFYHAALFGGPIEPVPLFEAATARASIEPERAAAYAAITGAGSAAAMAPDLAFSLAWKPLFMVLSNDELAGGLLRLVHQGHEIEPGEAWPLGAGEQVEVTSRLTRLEESKAGRSLTVRSVIERGGSKVAGLVSRFFIREAAEDAAFARRARESISLEIDVSDEALIRFLDGHDWLSIHKEAKVAPGDRLRLCCKVAEERPRRGPARFRAYGHLERGGVLAGSIALDEESDARVHPLRAAVEAAGGEWPTEGPGGLLPEKEKPASVLAKETAQVPDSMLSFAEVGHDRNPIHRSDTAARLAGLDRPIAHGMWTAARLHSLALGGLCRGHPERLKESRVEFLAPALPGEHLTLEALRAGVSDGDLHVTLTATARREGPVPLVRASARLSPPPTAYVFPGQGIQRREMGMDGYSRSAAARAVWDRADAFTREALGFSVLDIVRQNPKEIVASGRRLTHPRGVLHLTQFTQVAMAVLAQAQVAELREAGVMTEDAVTCGHSVGEYNALGAVLGILPIETLVEVVHQRGLVMHGLVPRNERAESGYRMGVVRPHHAGMGHEEVSGLVEQVRRESGHFVQIVNYNIRGRQYAVTGRVEALELLRRALLARARGTKPPYVEVPGIDVPFHSELLSEGVGAFREAIQAALPKKLPAEGLVGRYVPNLLAAPFSLERPFIEAIRDLTGSAPMAEVLSSYEASALDPDALARTIVVELLAWQFASPVRWIETQDLLFRSKEAGGLGVERLVEIGVAHQPVLTGMARATLSDLGSASLPVEVMHSEVDHDRVFLLDEGEGTASPAGGEEPATRSSNESSAPTAKAPSPGGARAAGASEIGDGAAAALVTAAVSTGPEKAAGQVTAGAADPATAGATGGAESAPDGAAGSLDRPASPLETLRLILAVQARMRTEQIDPEETIDGVFDGVSSRRNQALSDIGAEFGLGSIDGAHEKPLSSLAGELGRRASSWKPPGPYVRGVQDEAIARVLGRSGLGRKEARSYLAAGWNMGPALTGSALDLLALESREGDSSRGGPLGALAGEAPSGREAAHRMLDAAARLLAEKTGLPLRKRDEASRGASTTVDSAALKELEEKLCGEDGILMRTARDLAAHLGHDIDEAQKGEAGEDAKVASAGGRPRERAEEARLLNLLAEHGPEYEKLVQPRFDSRKHVAFSSMWASARRDLARLFHDAMNERAGDHALDEELGRLAAHTHGEGGEGLRESARWYSDKAGREGKEALAESLARLARGEPAPSPARVVPTRPRLEIASGGALHYEEVADEQPEALHRFTAEILGSGAVLARGSAASAGPALREALGSATSGPMAFHRRTAIVTGAGPGSIALEMVRHLLRGGARVVLTTSTYRRERLLLYRRLFQREATPGAELHVLPFNQASSQDVEALIEWVFSEVTEQAGAGVRVLKRAFVPDILIPFGALQQTGTIEDLGGRAEAALRAMLLGVERMIGAITRRLRSGGGPSARCHVLLPLSPNHGVFGGDGAYAESKAGLEVLLSRWHSEKDAWGGATSLCGARIGWVRGTGLMDANDPVAAALEEETGIRTFSSAEMGLMLAALCTKGLREAALESPLSVDLTGGIGELPELGARVRKIRARLDDAGRAGRRLAELSGREAELLGTAASEPKMVSGLGDWPRRRVREPYAGWPEGDARLAETVVIVGAGELGPFGSSRPRFEIEAEDDLSSAAVLELAWMTGLIRWEVGPPVGWRDAESGEHVPESEIKERYGQEVRGRSGIRFFEPDSRGWSPDHTEVLTTVWLERDLTFPVSSREEAESFRSADPDLTKIHFDAEKEQWSVTRSAGTKIRVPREVKLDRRVAGLLPEGFDPTRFGIPAEMAESVDPVTLFNLIATADAFLSAGLSPEELLRWIHPARFGNSQGAGIGGMKSLHRLYLDHFLDRERQKDVLQETLINVVAAYAVQSFTGSYGPMIHPVAACATAAVSLEEGMDKILLGKADVVLAGGFDDIGREGAVGFADMGATAGTEEAESMGLRADQISRPNDSRRRGFVEAQGGGSFLLARGDVAARMGLPVLGVLAYAGSFGDGINKSIPAPGLGALACAGGGRDSALGRALARFGLTADDISLVYKHDTSTAANDPNESELHDKIQEALGRSAGNPLWVVSQKSITGHSKGGAAAWQCIGLCQSLEAGVIPGNRNLENVDPEMKRHGRLGFTDETLRPGPAERLSAGLLTSLGFGHVGSVALVLHPDAFQSLIPEADRDAWLERSTKRRREAERLWAAVMMGETRAFEKRSHRRFASPDGSREQLGEEAAMLLDPLARLDPESGLFTAPSFARRRRLGDAEPAGSEPGAAKGAGR